LVNCSRGSYCEPRMTKTQDLKSFLASSTSPIVCDGGMATSLYDKGFYINRSFEELSLLSPEAVREVTRGFKKAGALLLGTNTFGATKPRMQEYNIEDRLEEVLRTSVHITKGVAGDEAYTMGVMGPLGL